MLFYTVHGSDHELAKILYEMMWLCNTYVSHCRVPVFRAQKIEGNKRLPYLRTTKIIIDQWVGPGRCSAAISTDKGYAAWATSKTAPGNAESTTGYSSTEE